MGGKILEYEASTIYDEGKAEGLAEANILAVINMLQLGNPESEVRRCYPEHFEEGKKKFLKSRE